MNKTIYVTIDAFCEAETYLSDTMLEVHKNTQYEYDNENGCADYDRNDWDSVIGDKRTRDTAFRILTNGLSYDDVDSMLAWEDYYVETEWDSIDYDIASARAMWGKLLDCSMELFHDKID